eukprot:CAMPEP_0197922980 /NCGR_PEP_ID=MMETSP1439-20131203/93188_1 /TAXON_ID=66791 /ORGANISM="Gonyaulax spinifera, Strain CCMP409" /LENGTH=46 /DNA_ID= /DNA_START= /DNA_END= /DNA_ORIENTATION=
MTSEGTGIFSCEPRGCTAHAYREALPMGETPLLESEVDDLIERLAK